MSPQVGLLLRCKEQLRLYEAVAPCWLALWREVGPVLDALGMGLHMWAGCGACQMPHGWACAGMKGSIFEGACMPTSGQLACMQQAQFSSKASPCKASHLKFRDTALFIRAPCAVLQNPCSPAIAGMALARRALGLLEQTSKTFIASSFGAAATQPCRAAVCGARAYASDADLKKTVLYDYHVSQGGAQSAPITLCHVLPLASLLLAAKATVTTMGLQRCRARRVSKSRARTHSMMSVHLYTRS